MAKTANDEKYLKELGEQGHNYWIGLKKTGTVWPCSNAACNNPPGGVGQLVWADGSDFVHNGMLPVSASTMDLDYGRCFFVETNGAFDEKCTTEKKTFFCQYECPGTTTTTTTTTPTTTSTSTHEVTCTPPQGLIDSGYWESYGKYYKV